MDNKSLKHKKINIFFQLYYFFHLQTFHNIVKMENWYMIYLFTFFHLFHIFKRQILKDFKYNAIDLLTLYILKAFTAKLLSVE